MVSTLRTAVLSGSMLLCIIHRIEAQISSTSFPAPPSPAINTQEPYTGLNDPNADIGMLNGTTDWYQHVTEPPAVTPAANSTNNINVISLAYVPTGMNIHFQTPFPVQGGPPTLKWGPTPATLTNTATGSARAYNRVPPCNPQTLTECSQYFYDIQITGLLPGTTYYYQIPSDGSFTSTGIMKFTTAKAVGDATPYNIDIICDMGYTNASGTHAQILNSVSSTDFLWHGGDISYADDWIDGIVGCSAGYDCVPDHTNSAGAFVPNHEGSGPRGGDVDSGYERSWDEWQQWMTPITTSIPYMVLPGNHEAACAEFDSSNYPVAGELNDNTTMLGIYPTGDPRRSPYDPNLVYYSCPPSQRNFTAYAHRFRMPTYESGAQVNHNGVPNANSNFWYSFDVGLVHYISLDGETDIPYSPEYTIARETGHTYETDSGPFGNYGTEGNGTGGQSLNNADYDQLQWLAKDLAAVDRTKTPWVLAMSHRPMYTSAVSPQPNGGTSSYEHNIKNAFEPLFHQYGVDMYFSGHIHLYDRLFPMYNSTVEQAAVIDYQNYIATGNSTTCVVQGMAGNIEDFSTGTQNLTYSAIFDNTHFGLGRLTVHNSTHLTYSFVHGSDGTVGDTFNLIKASYYNGTLPASGYQGIQSGAIQPPSSSNVSNNSAPNPPLANGTQSTGTVAPTTISTTAPGTTHAATTTAPTTAASTTHTVLPTSGSGTTKLAATTVPPTTAHTTSAATTHSSATTSGNSGVSTIQTTKPGTTKAATTAVTPSVGADVNNGYSTGTTTKPTTIAATTKPATTAAKTSTGTSSSNTGTTTTTTKPITFTPVQSAQQNATYTLGQALSNGTVSVSNTAICNVIDPTRKEAPWANSTQPYPQVYDANTYVCVNNNFLCPTAEPLVCGTVTGGQGCYSSSLYKCVNNQLQHV